MTLQVRDGTVDDGAACAQIYAHYVRDTAITFESEPPGVDEMAHRITAAHVWLVAEDDSGAVHGYAYGTEFKPRDAYRWSVETSVYLDPPRHRAGGGRLLYTGLLQRLSDRRRVGFKHGQWRDVAWLQLDLGEVDSPPAPIR